MLVVQPRAAGFEHDTIVAQVVTFAKDSPTNRAARRGGRQDPGGILPRRRVLRQ